MACEKTLTVEELDESDGKNRGAGECSNLGPAVVLEKEGKMHQVAGGDTRKLILRKCNVDLALESSGGLEEPRGGGPASDHDPAEL